MVRQGCYAGDVSYGVCESGLARGAGGRRKWLEKNLSRYPVKVG